MGFYEGVLFVQMYLVPCFLTLGMLRLRLEVAGSIA